LLLSYFPIELSGQPWTVGVPEVSCRRTVSLRN